MKPKKTKIAIVWANPYNKNLGVGALAYSSLALVHDICKEHNIDASFTFLGSSRDTSDEVKIGDQLIPFDNIKGLDFSSWKSLVKLLISFKKHKTRKILSFDIVFDMGEGDSFADIYGDKRFNRIYGSKAFFNFFKIKQVLLPQTIGPFNQNQKEKKAISIMKKLNLVLSRDKKSYEYTAQFLSPEKILELIDVAFYMPYALAPKIPGIVNVGINVSGLLWNGGYTGNNQFNMKTEYKSVVIRLVEYFYNLEDVQLHIVSHVIPEHQPIENDHLIALQLKEMYPNVTVAPIFKNPIEAKSYISGMDFFTGARMHACIAAFSSGVPVVPMAYSRKFNGLFGDTLDYKWIADCVNDDNDTVFNIVIGGFNNRIELSSGIDTSLNKIVKPRLEMLKSTLFQSINS